MTAPVADCYPTRSTKHLECAGARDLSDWLAHLRLKNRADRTLDDYERTIAALFLWRDYPVADPLACLLCETGIRKSEARNLQRRHIDLMRGNLTVYQGKGSKDRVVPLTSRASIVVADMDLTDGMSPEDHLWPTKPGGGQIVKRRDPISNTAMQTWWAAPASAVSPGVLARAGVDYRNMHVTRHTFATRLIRKGARIENVQQLMGHSSIQTTVDLYAHLDLEDARADLKLLEVEVA